MTKIQRVVLMGLALFGIVVWGISAVLIAFDRFDVSASEAASPLGVAAITATPTQVTQATPSPSSTVTPEPTLTATPTPSPSPTLTPQPKPTQPPTITPTPTPTPRLITLRDTLPSATPTATPSPPPTATPTATLPPSPTPLPLRATPTLAAVTAADRYLLVDQGLQVMRVYEAGEVVRDIPVSTGRPVSNAFTPPWQGAVGEYWGRSGFVDRDLIADYIWYLFPGPEGSILIHSVPYLLKDGEKEYDNLAALGVEPVSSGCIRISPDDAAWLKTWNPSGVPIEIKAPPFRITPAAEVSVP